MFTRVQSLIGGAILASALCLGATAGAATLNTIAFERKNLPGAQKAFEDNLAGYQIKSLNVETFEGTKAWDGKAERFEKLVNAP